MKSCLLNLTCIPLILCGSLHAATYPSSDIPKTINSTGTPTVTSVISIPADSGNITDINVSLNISHTWADDLDITLIHPDGTRIELSTDNGGNGDNYINTVFDQQAGSSISGGSPPFTGTFRPEGDLGLLDGKPADGTWALEVHDDTSSDGGTLNAWSLDVSSGNPDLDDDGLPNGWETANGLDPNDDGSVNPDNGAFGDPDGDGLPNDEEYFMNSDPQVNESGKAWEARPEKAQLMVISAHPDDEGIFFGGVIPYYTQVRQLSTVCVSMTSGDYGREPEVREAELRNAVWTYGLRNQPIFPRFKDYWSTTVNGTWDVWGDGVEDGQGEAEGREKAGKALAYWIRRYRPEVVVSHDLGGEYGHGNHMATGWASADAVAVAADPLVDLGGLPAWQVKKLYLHNYGSNRLFHDHWQDTSIDTDGNGSPDQTPIQVANAGLVSHASQGSQTVSTCYAVGEASNSDFEPYPCEWWGLYSTTVGNDTVKPDWLGPNADNQTITYSGWARGDFFENLGIQSGAADTDSDGMPDWWEDGHGLDSTVASSASDPDFDSYDNMAEYVADTDPQDGDSYLTFAIELVSGDPVLRFGTSSKRGYVVEYRDDLMTGAWQDLGPASQGTGSEVVVPDSTSASNRFYRVRVKLP